MDKIVSARFPGVNANQQLRSISYKGGLKIAESLQIPFAAIIGEEELKSGSCELKEMASHTSTKIPLKTLAKAIQEKSGV